MTVAKIELVPEVVRDFERILEHLTQHAAFDAEQHTKDILIAIDILEKNPLIGRPVESEKRELVIGRRGRGYVALYRYLEVMDTIFILTVRSQRESGYAR
jgi:toxin ParE1/3/4